MRAFLLPVALQIIGLAVIIMEIFIPSLGILTVIALGIYAYSLYLAFSSISATVGWVMLGVDIVLVPIAVIAGMKVLAKSSLSLHRELSKKDGVVSQSQALERFLKKSGKSVTNLRPAGAAMIDSERVDVVTDGEYIEKDIPVKVVGITGNRIVVEKID